MPNTLKIKRGTNATIPQGQLAEPLFTTDTYDLYIGKGSGGNQRFQKYIASGTSSQFLKGDGSLDSNTYQTALTFSSPLVNTSGTISIPAATGSVNGYLTSTDWTTFNSKEPAITAGTSLQYYRGDKTFQTLNTAAVPESGAIYFTEPRVLTTVLTGLNLSGGGTIAATDSVLTAFGKIQNQISGIAGGVSYQGTWNANTNSPTLTSSVGTKGYYYVVSVNGSTNLNGITDWKVGDWAIFNGTTWDKVDNTDAVSSVNGFTGAVNLGLGDISNVTLTSPTNAQLLRFNGTSSKWENWTPTYISAAITSLNGLTAATQTFATGTTGTDFTISSSTSTHTFNIPSASATSRGLLDTSDYNTFAGKQSAITLTTNNTSGAATFIGATLNIPQYQAALTNPVTGTGTINQIAYFNATGSTIASLSTATYPSLTELSYVKGVTSSIQTQLNGKQATLTNPVTGTGTTDYIPQFTGTSAIGNSIIQVYSTNQIGVGSTPFNSGARFVIDDSNLSFTPLLVKSGYTGAVANLAGLKLYRYDYSTGTDGIGIAFDQTNSSSSQTTYAAMYGYPQTRTAGSEGGLFRIYNKRAGTNTIALEIDQNGNAFMNTKIMKLNTSTSFGTADSYIVLNEPTAAATAGLLLSTNSTLRSYLTSSNAGTTLGVVSGSGPFYINVAASNVLTIAQSGAATFSSSVTAGGNIQTDGGANKYIKATGFISNQIGQLSDFGASDAGFYIVSGGGTQFVTGGANVMRITSAGNVGIGSNSPTNFGAGYTTLGIDGSTSGGVVDIMVGGSRSLTIAVDGSEPSISSRISGNPIVFRTNNAGTVAERMRITSGGAINIGTSSATGGIRFQRGSSTGQIGYVTSDIPGYSDMAGIEFYADNVSGGSQAGSIRFNTSNAATSSERMRINSNGNVSIGNTSSTYRLDVSLDSGSNGQIIRLNRSAGAYGWGLGIDATNSNFNFYNNAGTSVSNINNSTGVYIATSDARLKENIIDSESTISKLGLIKVRKYNWKESNIEEHYGFIAQELYEVLPQYVLKGDDNNNWGVAKAELVPFLVKAIQEQQIQIEELKLKLS